ncbi:methionyl-tRNA formyltransferase [Bacillus oleivorans]|uniref:Methionyl-tRNA formyltransferase n=1 Tax=Bacillus oleivorans TaxID=1448271 RepID=A0A285D1A3_9BACI|nr:methionyl-tRNA formyltransferase [Bacillus oleivorans]SNX73539.1 methionyl-tRNA formyltransferase [Bacillus oleivorans]
MTRIVFMGTPDFSVPVLEKLLEHNYQVVGVVTQPDRPVGRKKVLTPPPVKIAAEKHGIPVYQPEKIRAEYHDILNLEPDLIVTAAYGQIVPNEVLEYPSYGCINVHASLLPELRGGAPIHYAILQGKEKTGVTIMYMAEKLDAGDMIAKIEVPILETDHVGTLHDKLSEAGANLLAETIPSIINRTAEVTPQDHTKATFAPNIKREQEEIDWSRSGEDIYNHIRGLYPWPVAFTIFHGEVWKIWWGEKVHNLESNDHSGTILAIEANGIVVKTGNETAIRITELQVSGKKRMSASEFLRGIADKLAIGMRLGREHD